MLAGKINHMLYRNIKTGDSSNYWQVRRQLQIHKKMWDNHKVY
jgi:hypothetical protein